MLQLSALALGMVLWSAGMLLRRRDASKPWMTNTVLTAAGYAIVAGIALTLKANFVS